MRGVANLSAAACRMLQCVHVTVEQDMLEKKQGFWFSLQSSANEMQHSAMPLMQRADTAPAQSLAFSAAAYEVECSQVAKVGMCSSVLGRAGTASDACEDAADAFCHEDIA